MRYVGIENSKYKSRAMKFAPKTGTKKTLSLPCLIADDCNRHLEVLRLFDRGIRDVNGMKNTLYYSFNKKNKKSNKAIQEKINRFIRLYKSIQNRGYEYSRGYIVLSTDGARVDGSHRASIVEHIGFRSLDVLFIDWSDYCTKSELKQMQRHLKSQQEKYGAFKDT